MSNRAERLQTPGLYVVSSDYLNGKDRTIFQYPKVAAVSLGERRVSYVSPNKNDGYSPTDLQLLDSEVEESLLGRVASFVDAYMADDASRSSYNCHTFSSWMIDGPETTNPLATKDEVVSTYQPLCPGEIGIIYARGGDHSTIGLGSGRTMQVLTNYGNIGILSFDQLITQYGGDPGIVHPAIAQRKGIRSPK